MEELFAGLGGPGGQGEQGGQGRGSKNGRVSAGGFNLADIANAAFEENKFDKEKLDRMYQFPADYKEAKVHQMASKFGYSNGKLKNEQDVPVCPCCQNQTSTMELPLCYSTIPGKPEVGEDVFLIMTDVSMYFTFIKMAIIYLILRFLVFDLFNIMKSIDGGYCAEVSSSDDPCAYFRSGYNLKSAKDQDVLNIIDILCLSFTILSIVFFLIFRKQQYQLRDWLDFNEISQDDFTVLIEDVPKFIYEQDTSKEDVDYYYELELKGRIEEKLMDWLEEIKNYKNENQCRDKLEKDFWKFIFKKNADQKTNDPDDNDLFYQELVTSITVCYDLTEIENLNQFRNQLVEKYLARNEAADGKQSKLMSHIPNQIDVLNKEYIALCEKFALDESPAFNLSHFTGKAFISFQYQHFRDYCVREAEKNPEWLQICGSNIRVSKTNQPTDIYWYNMKVSDSERHRNIFYSYCILFMMLILSFAALIGLQFWEVAEHAKHYENSLGDKLKSYLVTGSMAVLTNIINFILGSSIQILSDMERHKTKSDRLTSLIVKTIITQFINTSIIYTILYLMKPSNPLGTFGLVSKVTSLVVISGFISVAMQVFIPKNVVMGLINRWKYPEDKPVNLFQLQLNQMMQHPEFNYAAMYSFYIVFTYVVSFYGFLVPTATPILIIIFFIQYWVDKYNLFRRFSSSTPFGQDLIRILLKSFEVSLLLFVAGFFVWDSFIHYDSKPLFRTLNIINIAITVVYICFSAFVPYRIKAKCFGEDNVSYERLPYSHHRAKNAFEKTFWRESPATSCLKETKILQKKESVEAVNEAPDPKFIQKSEFDKFLNLSDDEKFIQKYSEQIVKFVANMQNQNYDYVEELEGSVEVEVDHEKKKKSKKKGGK